MTAHHPMISIVVPCWNVAPFLDEALRSIREQTFGAFEVLMVDDASVDDTFDVMKRWAAHDRRFVALRHRQNLGVVRARNTALAAASGEFVAMLDGDDRWTPDALAHRLDVARAFPDAAVVATDFSWFGDGIDDDAAGRILLGARSRRTFADVHAARRPVLIADPFDDVATLHFAWTGATLVRRDAFESIGCFDVHFDGPEDTLVWLKLANRFAFAYSPRVTAGYRQWHGSAIRAWRIPKEAKYLSVLRHARADPSFVGRTRTLDRLAAECHERSAVHFRAAQEIARAIRHAAASVRLAPATLGHWRELTACGADLLHSQARRPIAYCRSRKLSLTRSGRRSPALHE